MKKQKKIINYLILCAIMLGFKTVVNAAGSTLNCSDWNEVLTDFQNIFNFCKIVIPLLIIGLGIFDFVKAVAGKDDKDLKKAGTKLMKRLALAIVFFFLPVILNLFLDLMGANTSVCVN